MPVLTTGAIKLDSRALTYFLAVAESGSFTAAAEQRLEELKALKESPFYITEEELKGMKELKMVLNPVNFYRGDLSFL